MIKKVKLFNGSVYSFMLAYGEGHKSVRDYELLLQLKSEFPRSFIPNYKSRRKELAQIIGRSERTLDRYINRWLGLGLVFMEKNTLRLISNTTIKQEFGKTKKVKRVKNDKSKWVKTWAFTEIHAKDIHEAVKSQAVREKVVQQEKVREFKKVTSSRGETVSQKQSEWTMLRNANPTAIHRVNEDIFVSQNLAAALMGYRSQRSGHIHLQKLQAGGILGVSANSVKVEEHERHFFRRAGVIHKVKKGFYCFPNSVAITLSYDKPEYQNTLDPKKMRPIMERYPINDYWLSMY